MFTESAELYDLVYGTFKDFEAEAADVASLIRALHPEACRILDVGCGTGEHAKHLTNTYGYSVDGLDIDAGLLAMARGKLPKAGFFEKDMASFDLDDRFDVVLCLFSSIGYLRSLDRASSALACFRRHLCPGGLIAIEPWYEPGILSEGPGAERFAEGPGIRVTRRAFTRVANRLSLLRFTYIIETQGHTQVRDELHELGLFTREEMLNCFAQAGLLAEYQVPGQSDRGLYVGKLAE